MNSGMHSETLEGGATANRNAMGRFYAEMAEGLHAMAQPLTILRSSVVSLAAPGLTQAHQERYINISTQQVERACALFDCLQDLVIANQIEAARAPFALSELLDAIEEDLRTKLEASGVKLKIVATEGLQPILGDFARTLKALLAALKIAVALSSPDDTVELRAAPSNGMVGLTISNRLAHRRTLNSSENLSIVLAEANIRSQQGEFECLEDPFFVSVVLPSQDVDP
jgi:hypothetical protein